MTVLVLLFAYFAIGLILNYRNRLRAPLFQIAASMLIVLLWPIPLCFEIMKLWSADRFRVGFAAYDPAQPSRSEIPQYTFFVSWAEAIVYAKDLAHSSGRKVTIRDEARYDKGFSGYLPRYVTLAPGGEVLDASSSQIYQKYMNDSAWLNPESESVSTHTYEKGVQAFREGAYATAMRAFRASAEDGEPSAMYWVGIMYNEGKGVSVNHCEAAQWFLKAAEGGHSQAQFVLGGMYQTGIGVAANLHETIRWWRKAAEQDNSQAQHNLGMMDAQGEDVRENSLEARQWDEKATEHLKSRAMPDVPEALSATALSEAPSRPLLPSNYFVRHWRGELSLGISYWVNGSLPNIAPIALFAAYESVDTKDSYSLRAMSFAAIGIILFSVTAWVWSSVGIWRSANHHVTRGGSSRWASMARVMVVLGSFSVMGQLTSTILPQLKEYALIASGNDPIGNIDIKVAANGQSVIVDGILREGSAVEVQKILDAAPGATSVVLNSAGGRMGEAQQLAHIVRSRHLNTYVEDECASACTYVFLAGKDRVATPNARIGFHQPSFPGLDTKSQRAATEDMLDVYRTAELPEAFLQRIAKTPPDDMWYPTSDELIAANVITRLSLGDEEWILIDNDKPGMTIYVNPDTITRKGNLVKMWELFDFETAEHVADSTHLSFKMHSEYNCTEGHKRELAMESFSGNMGRGNVVRIYSPEGTWEPVPPGSVDHDLWEFACGKERLQAQFYPVEGETG